MVVHDLNLVWALPCPSKADAELIVDANTVLPLSITAKRFKPLPGREAQFLQVNNGIELIQSTSGDLPQVFWAGPSSGGAVDTVEKIFRARMPEGLYHEYMITRNIYYFNP